MKIPQKIHRVWIGGEMPPPFVAYEERWRALHPGWEVRTWREADLGWLQNRAAFDDAPKLSSKSNIARYEIVLREGGLYVDTDYEPLRSFDTLLDDDAELIVAQEEPDFLANAIFGAVAGSAVLQSLVDNLPSSHYSRDGEISPQRTGPHYFTRAVRRGLVEHPDTKVQVLAREQVIPYSWKQGHLAEARFPHAHAVHHWAKSWVGTAATAPATTPTVSTPTAATRSAARGAARRLVREGAVRSKAATRRVAAAWDRIEPARPSGVPHALPVGDGRVLLVTASGLATLVPADRLDVIAGVLVDGEHEPAYLAFLRRELRDGDVVAQVGVPTAVTALQCAWRVGRMGRVYAVDADAPSAALVDASAALSRRRGLQAEVLAVAARVGLGPDDRRLDDILRGNPDVGLVRIAVGGAEAGVLATMDELLADGSVRLLDVRVSDVESGASWPMLAQRLLDIDRTWRPSTFTLSATGERVPLTVEAAINSDLVEHLVLDFGAQRAG